MKTIKIPKEQVNLIHSALNALEKSLLSIRDGGHCLVDETIHHTLFDLCTLKGLFNGNDVDVMLSDDQVKNFGKYYGVDLPQYADSGKIFTVKVEQTLIGERLIYAENEAQAKEIAGDLEDFAEDVEHCSFEANEAKEGLKDNSMVILRGERNMLDVKTVKELR